MRVEEIRKNIAQRRQDALGKWRKLRENAPVAADIYIPDFAETERELLDS